MLSRTNKGVIATVPVLWVLALFTYGCNYRTAAIDNHGPYQAEADAAVTLTWAGEPVLIGTGGDSPSPSPDPSPDVRRPCNRCDERGRSGDGLGPCGVCGGDKWIDPEDAFQPPPIGDKPATSETQEFDQKIRDMLAKAAAAIDPEIPSGDQAADAEIKSVVLYLNNSNYAGWPKDWWLNERAKMVAAGFTVSHVRDWEGDEVSDAYFVLTRGDKTMTIRGKKTAAQLIMYEE